MWRMCWGRNGLMWGGWGGDEMVVDAPASANTM